MTKEQIEAIRQRAEKAKALSWQERQEFIANVRKDIPELLAVIERLQSQQARLLAELKKADESYEALEKRYISETLPAFSEKIAEFIRKESER